LKIVLLRVWIKPKQLEAIKFNHDLIFETTGEFNLPDPEMFSIVKTLRVKDRIAGIESLIDIDFDLASIIIRPIISSFT